MHHSLGRRRRRKSEEVNIGGGLSRPHSLPQLARRFQQFRRHLLALQHTGLVGEPRQQVVVDSARDAARPLQLAGNLVQAQQRCAQTLHLP